MAVNFSKSLSYEAIAVKLAAENMVAFADTLAETVLLAVTLAVLLTKAKVWFPVTLALMFLEALEVMFAVWLAVTFLLMLETKVALVVELT